MRKDGRHSRRFTKPEADRMNFSSELNPSQSPISDLMIPPLPIRPVSRRFVLVNGSRIYALASLGALAAALSLPGESFGQEWLRLHQSKPQGGHGIVKELLGRATAQGRPLRVGSRVDSGEEIRVLPNGRMILSLSDKSAMRINGNTIITLEIGHNRTGFFRLLVGSLLSVMPSGHRYLVHLPTVTIGIKGTIFFQQIFHQGEKIAIDDEQREVPIPEGVSEYFCICNGAIDLLHQETKSAVFTDVAEYHNSYYIDPRLSHPFVEAPQLNHYDDHILHLVGHQEGEKHDTRFLEGY